MYWWFSNLRHCIWLSPLVAIGNFSRLPNGRSTPGRNWQASGLEQFFYILSLNEPIFDKVLGSFVWLPGSVPIGCIQKHWLYFFRVLLLLNYREYQEVILIFFFKYLYKRFWKALFLWILQCSPRQVTVIILTCFLTFTYCMIDVVLCRFMPFHLFGLALAAWP